MKTVYFIKTMKMLTACFLAMLLMITGVPMNVFAEADKPSESILIVKGDIKSIPAKNVKRVSITDPAVADINDARADNVDIIGIDPGQTILFIWDESGKRTVLIRIVGEDPTIVKRRVQSLLADVGIIDVMANVNSDEGKVILSGILPEDKLDLMTRVIEPFADRVINLVQKEKVEDLVQIDMQITELSTTLTKEIGVDWGMGVANAPLTPNFAERLPSTSIPRGSGSLRDIWKVGSFTRTNALVMAINALIEQGKGKILSKPRLVVISGKEALFNVGGEVPIKSVTSNNTGGLITENTTFKQYGVTMAVTPSIQAENLVNITLNTEISEIDGSKPTGTDVAFLTRSAKTQLLLQDHQTIVLAGMIKRRTNEMVRRVPFLSKIPLLGMLFRTNKTPAPNEETEVVISITATILRVGKNADLAEQEAAPAQNVPAVEEQGISSTEKKLRETRIKRAMSDIKTSEKPRVTSNTMKSKVTPAASVSQAIPVTAVTPKAPSKTIQIAPETKADVAEVLPVKDVTEPKDKVMPIQPEVKQSIGKKVMAPMTEQDKYALGIQEKISSAIAYPYEAQEKNWCGVVRLTLVLNKEGTLTDVKVKKSSGYPVFDQDSVNTAQILASYAPFPAAIKSEMLEVTISIVYSIDSFLKNVATHK